MLTKERETKEAFELSNQTLGTFIEVVFKDVLKLTQNRFSKETNIDATDMSRIVRGLQTVSHQYQEQIAKRIGVPASFLSAILHNEIELNDAIDLYLTGRVGAYPKADPAIDTIVLPDSLTPEEKEIAREVVFAIIRRRAGITAHAIGERIRAEQLDEAARKRLADGEQPLESE